MTAQWAVRADLTEPAGESDSPRLHQKKRLAKASLFFNEIRPCGRVKSTTWVKSLRGEIPLRGEKDGFHFPVSESERFHSRRTPLISPFAARQKISLPPQIKIFQKKRSFPPPQQPVALHSLRLMIEFRSGGGPTKAVNPLQRRRPVGRLFFCAHMLFPACGHTVFINGKEV